MGHPSNFIRDLAIRRNLTIPTCKDPHRTCRKRMIRPHSQIVSLDDTPYGDTVSEMKAHSMISAILEVLLKESKLYCQGYNVRTDV